MFVIPYARPFRCTRSAESFLCSGHVSCSSLICSLFSSVPRALIDLFVSWRNFLRCRREGRSLRHSDDRAHVPKCSRPWRVYFRWRSIHGRRLHYSPSSTGTLYVTVTRRIVSADFTNHYTNPHMSTPFLVVASSLLEAAESTGLQRGRQSLPLSDVSYNFNRVQGLQGGAYFTHRQSRTRIHYWRPTTTGLYHGLHCADRKNRNRNLYKGTKSSTRYSTWTEMGPSCLVVVRFVCYTSNLAAPANKKPSETNAQTNRGTVWTKYTKHGRRSSATDRRQLSGQ